MDKNKFRQTRGILAHAGQLALMTGSVSVVTGSLVAFFLWSLEEVTSFRLRHIWLLWLLPLAGLAIHFLYKQWGRSSERGNDLVIEAIHQPGAGVPVRMAPLVLVTTLITHLFGGSAGREGTAVQMGGSLAAWLARKLHISLARLPLMLQLGVAAGFGAVFGTPLAGAVFAVEVPARGKLAVRAFLPCLAASALGNWVCLLWGIQHVHYSISSLYPANGFVHISLPLLWRSGFAGAIFGIVAWMFVLLCRGLKKMAVTHVAPLWLMPVTGGVAIIALTHLLGTEAYLGLGVVSQPGSTSILSAFATGGAAQFAWLWKIIFTVLTLSLGFKGGEVTPLFFIGATLGNTLSGYLDVPVDLCAGLGFIAVFAAAANTPIACIFMGVELFGAEFIAYYTIACYAAFFASGRPSIYHAQR